VVRPVKFVTMLDLRLPSQPQSVTGHLPLPNYTAWWQVTMVWTTCPQPLRSSALTGSRPLDQRPTPNALRHYATCIFSDACGVSGGC